MDDNSSVGEEDPATAADPNETPVSNETSKLVGFNYEKLFPFQKEGVTFGISKKGRYLLGDEMGVGKTA